MQSRLRLERLENRETPAAGDPIATVERAPAQESPTHIPRIEFVVTFSEPVQGFEASDVFIEERYVGMSLDVEVVGDGPAYSVIVTGLTGSVPVNVKIPAGVVTDLEGNPNAESDFARVYFYENHFVHSVLPDGAADFPYEFQLSVAGEYNSTFFDFTITSGELPVGMTLETHAYLHGRPITFGDFPIEITAKHRFSDYSISKSYVLRIHTPGDPLILSGRPDGAAYEFRPDLQGVYRGQYKFSPFGSGEFAVRSAAGDVNGDGWPDFILVTGPGVPIRMAIVDGYAIFDGSALLPPTAPFAGSEEFDGGGFVAAMDLTGDGRAEFVVTADEGGGPRVIIFSLADDGALSVLADFYGIEDPDFRGGSRVALGDVNHDGKIDLLSAAGFGGGPRVALFDGSTLFSTRTKLCPDFYAFPEDAVTLRNGTYVALGDINGDGFADLIFGGGPGGGPRIFILSGELLTAGDPNLFTRPLANFFAGVSSNRGGVRVAVKNADRDIYADLAVGSIEDTYPVALLYLGKDIPSPDQSGQTARGLAPWDNTYNGLADFGIHVG